MLLLLILAMLSIPTKGSSQELFVFSDMAFLVERSFEKLNCDSVPAMGRFELLSPAIEQGRSFSLLIAVFHEPGKPYLLQAGQYPSGTFPLRLHKFIPAIDDVEELVEVSIPFRGRLAEAQKCAIFLLDVDVPPSVPIGRIKLEPALWAYGLNPESYWLRQPLEIRIVPHSKANFTSNRNCPEVETQLGRIIARNYASQSMPCPNSVTLWNQREEVLNSRKQTGRSQ